MDCEVIIRLMCRNKSGNEVEVTQIPFHVHINNVRGKSDKFVCNACQLIALKEARQYVASSPGLSACRPEVVSCEVF